MKTVLAFLVCFLSIAAASGQGLYVKTFGNSKSKPLIFLHGGPGYNSAGFEATTAQQLADSGYYVIVYDRRGEGRSKDPNAKYNFEETFSDLQDIYIRCWIKKATIVGHSFGGIVATMFANKYPEKVNAVVLVSAPVNLQETFKTIIRTTKVIYQAKNDTVNLNYLNLLGVMDTTSMQYASYCFAHAMSNGFYSPKKPTEEAKKIYIDFKADTLYKYASQMSYAGPSGFLRNEKYTSIDLSDSLKALLARGIPIYGLYGKDDGLYSSEQVMALQKLIGDSNLIYLDNCSHNVFIDQQTAFIAALKTWVHDDKPVANAMPNNGTVTMAVDPHPYNYDWDKDTTSTKQTDTVKKTVAADSIKMSGLMIYGPDYLYSVKEPDGWKSDQKNAKEFDADIVLFMNNDSVNNGGALVQLLSFKKADDSTALDLQSDIEQYKNNFPKLVEEDFTTQHAEYKCYARCLSVEGEFYQYLVYVNPGPKYKRGVSIALNTAKRRPTDAEMEGFHKIVASLIVFK